MSKTETGEPRSVHLCGVATESEEENSISYANIEPAVEVESALGGNSDDKGWPFRAMHCRPREWMSGVAKVARENIDRNWQKDHNEGGGEDEQPQKSGFVHFGL